MAMRALGIFLWAVIFLMLEATADNIIAITKSSALARLGLVPFKTVFVFFTDPSSWLTGGTLAIGHAALKSGLFRRVTLLLIKMFPATVRGQTPVLTGEPTIIAPFIPSITAKGALYFALSKGL